MKAVNVCAALFILAVCFVAPAAASDASGGSVVVRQGQNLSSIAAQYGVSVRQLTEWNNLDSPEKVRAGQKLIVRPPAGSAAAPPAKAESGAKAPGSASPAPAQRAGKGAAKAASPSPLPPSPVEVAAPEGVPEKVKSDLSGVAHTLVHNAARNIRPSAASKAVSPGAGGAVTASYMEVDVSSVRAEVIPSAEKGKYVGSIRYVEHQYECPGKNKAEALQAECGKVKSRRMNELIRYEQGKWHY